MSKATAAAIGAGVCVAAASVITLLVVKGEPEVTEERGTPLASFTPPQIPKTLPEPPPKPYPAPADRPAVAAPTAAKAEADQAKAEAEQAKADALAARTRAIARARQAGVLGQTIPPGYASLTGTGDISSGINDTTIYGGLNGTTGSTGGLVGSGPYGTIGPGIGYTYSGARGGMRPRTAGVPTISLGQFAVTPTVATAADPGNLDKAIVRRYIKRNVNKLQYCYEKTLLARPTIKGTVAVTFAIEENGTVTNATASGVDGDVSSCINSVISTIEFPKPRGVGGVQVATGFTFRPAGD